MKSVAILQHDPAQQPGYLLDFLASRDVPCRVLRTGEGESVPASARDWSGVVVLGSSRSVNEPIDWIRAEEALVLDAFDADIPVLGHCFGGQLMARALGAPVGRCPWPNIGFSPIVATPSGRAWSDSDRFLSFHWHHETFAIPRRATRVFHGRHILNEGFAIGRHLALQSHLEVTEATVRLWCVQDRDELLAAEGPWAQSEADILSGIARKIAALHGNARRIYATWAGGIDRPRFIAAHRTSQRRAALRSPWDRVGVRRRA